LKNTGQCPKCESTNLWDNTHLKQKGPVIIRKWIMVATAWRPTRRKYAFKDEYVCMNCGYSETFIEEEGLETIREYGNQER
jgi:predicted nucleic-acid-binding Zn-ribbon protein